MFSLATPHIRTLLYALLLGVLSVLLIPSAADGVVGAPTIDFTNPIPLHGYAWSGYTDAAGNEVGVGWIDMSGVEVQPSGGSSAELTGYAWSSNIGWIKFGGLSSWPTGGGTSPQNATINENGELSGWARACAGEEHGTCIEMLDAPGGWDGWISLGGSGYGITFDVANQAGDGSYPMDTTDKYAWGGSTVMGWIDFGNVTLGGTPTPSLTATDCTVPAGASSCNVTLTWDAAGNPSPEIQPGGQVVGDTGSDPRTVNASGDPTTFTFRLFSNGTEIAQDTATASCAAGTSWDGTIDSCESTTSDLPDLENNYSYSSRGGYNLVTGVYNTVNIGFRMPNTGATTTAYQGDSSVEWQLMYDDQGRPNNVTIIGGRSAIDAGANPLVNTDIGPLPFGIYDLDIVSDPANGIVESNESNNAAAPTPTITLPPQDPDIDFGPDGATNFVRSGGRATIEWNTKAEYPMDCAVTGPGISVPNFNPAVDGPIGMVETTPRYNAGIYTIACDVLYPGINTTFTSTLRIEVIPALQEI